MDKAVTEFFMKMEKVPTVTAQERRVRIVKGKPVFYDSPRIKSAKALLVAHLKQHRPPKPYDSGVRLRVSWLFPKGRHKDGEYRITKPDTDNLQKMLKDCMTLCGFWTDDALVAIEICEKLWADVPGIYIRIEQL